MRMKRRKVVGGPMQRVSAAWAFYESGVRMQGMREELVLQLMPLHPNEQQNEAYSYATRGSGANAEFCCSGARVAKQRSDAAAFMGCDAGKVIYVAEGRNRAIRHVEECLRKLICSWREVELGRYAT